MSKEFQRIKERNDVRKQLDEFIGNSLSRAVSVTRIYYDGFFFQNIY